MPNTPATRTDRRADQRRATKRIRRYVEQGFGSTREAGAALGVNHATLWRAMVGASKRGAGTRLLAALSLHSGRPVEYWLGRGDD